MDGISRTMRFFQQLLIKLSTWGTQILPLKLSTPSTSIVVSCDLLIVVFFLSSLKFSSSNCLDLIYLMNVSLHSMLANTPHFFWYAQLHEHRFQSVCNNISITRMVLNGHIIVLELLHPPLLSQIKIILSEHMFRTVMICKNFTLNTIDVMSPDL